MANLMTGFASERIVETVALPVLFVGGEELIGSADDALRIGARFQSGL
jgi:hypothetical protein